MLKAVRQSLRETGYIDGQNVTIDFHWAEALWLSTDKIRKTANEVSATIIYQRRCFVNFNIGEKSAQR